MADRERRMPEGAEPALMGVIGGRRLSKNSGESMGPKVTLLRVILLGGSESSLLAGRKPESSEPESSEVLLLTLLLLRDRFLPLGGVGVADSSTSWMEVRRDEDFLDRCEDLREVSSCRGGMGVGTFSGLALEEEEGVATRGAF